MGQHLHSIFKNENKMKRMKKSIFLICTALLLGAGVFNSCANRTEYPDISATIYGVVTEQGNGEPVAGANVVLSPGGRATITGTDGRFEFPNLEPRQYEITVQRAGFQTNRAPVTAIAGRKVGRNISLTRID